MVQSSDKVQLGTPQTKPPNSGRPQTPPKAPWLEVLKPGDREAKYSDRKVFCFVKAVIYIFLPLLSGFQNFLQKILLLFLVYSLIWLINFSPAVFPHDTCTFLRY